MFVLPFAAGGRGIESGGKSVDRGGDFEWGEEQSAVVYHGEGAGEGGAVCAWCEWSGRRRGARFVCDYRADGCGRVQHHAAGFFAGGESAYGQGRESKHYFPDTDTGVWGGID